MTQPSFPSPCMAELQAQALSHHCPLGSQPPTHSTPLTRLCQQHLQLQRQEQHLRLHQYPHLRSLQVLGRGYQPGPPAAGSSYEQAARPAASPPLTSTVHGDAIAVPHVKVREPYPDAPALAAAATAKHWGYRQAQQRNARASRPLALQPLSPPAHPSEQLPQLLLPALPPALVMPLLQLLVLAWVRVPQRQLPSDAYCRHSPGQQSNQQQRSRLPNVLQPDPPAGLPAAALPAVVPCAVHLAGVAQRLAARRAPLSPAQAPGVWVPIALALRPALYPALPPAQPQTRRSAALPRLVAQPVPHLPYLLNLPCRLYLYPPCSAAPAPAPPPAPPAVRPCTASAARCCTCHTATRTAGTSRTSCWTPGPTLAAPAAQHPLEAHLHPAPKRLLAQALPYRSLKPLHAASPQPRDLFSTPCRDRHGQERPAPDLHPGSGP